jgi:DNA-binding response OmpR family regulator
VPTVLIVEDNRGIRDALRVALELEGYSVLAVGDGSRALEMLSPLPDLLILDLMLPGMSGLELCREIRRKYDVPILVLSARAEEIDRVVGLELGADDYVTKPFSMRELLLRAKAILRRTRAEGATDQTLQLRNVTIDLNRRQVRRSGQPIELTRLEFDLLAFLAEHRGQVFSRDKLMNSVWKEDERYASRTVDVHIRRLREKLEEDPTAPKLLETVRGVGYRISPD